MSVPRSYRVLGVEVHAVTLDQLNETITRTIVEGRRRIIGCHNLHSVHLYHRDPEMRAFYEVADDIHADGMPIVWLGRWTGYNLTAEHRVTWMDWIEPLIDLSARNGWRIYYLGSKPGVAQAAAVILAQHYPGLEMETAHGYFDATRGSEDNRLIVDRINAYQPDILMVGMGQPRQEKWVAAHAEQLNARVIVTPGACMDYVAGLVRVPPRWMGRVGLEWVYRFYTDPRRMFTRYLIEPWFLTGLACKDLLRQSGRQERGR